MMKSAALVLVISSVPLFGAVNATAQSFDLGLQVTPQAGWFLPTNVLFQLPDTAADHHGERVRLTQGLMVGIEADLRLPLPIIGLRSGLWYGAGVDFKPERQTSDALVIDGGGVFIGTVDLVVRTPRLGFGQAFGVLGGGIKWYHFPTEGVEPRFRDYAGDGATSGTLRVGVGLDVSLSNLNIRAGANSYLGAYDSAPRTSYHPFGTPQTVDFDFSQIDLLFTVGIGFRAF